MAVRGILFDFGETLTPQSMSRVLRRPATFRRLSRLIAASAWQLSPLIGLYRLYREYNRARVEMEIVGQDFPLSHLVARALGPLPGDPRQRGEAAARLAEALESSLEAEVNLYPGVAMLARKLAGEGYRLGILSNGIYSSRFVRGVLTRYEIDSLFYPVMVSCEEGSRKPDRALYLTACERLGLPPDEVAYVGNDWEKDVVGARAVGLEPIWFQPKRSRDARGRQGAAGRDNPALTPAPTFSDWRRFTGLLTGFTRGRQPE